MKAGFQWGSVLCMAPWVQPTSVTQSKRARSAVGVVPKVRSSSVTDPVASSRRRQRVIRSLFKSRTKQIVYRTYVLHLLCAWDGPASTRVRGSEARCPCSAPQSMVYTGRPGHMPRGLGASGKCRPSLPTCQAE